MKSLLSVKLIDAQKNILVMIDIPKSVEVIDLEKMYEKHYSSKAKTRGYGLYSLKHAEEIIGLLNESNHEAVHAMFGDEMKLGLPVKDMEELTPVIEESGSFEPIDKSSVEEDNSLYITIIVAKYSNKNRIFTITFNENEEVFGLFIK